MRPVVEGMGLDWKSQHAKLAGNLRRWSVEQIATTAEDGKQRLMTCLPLRKLLGWLSTISPNKVGPELRETILAYQEECDDALWAHWSQRLAEGHPMLCTEHRRNAIADAVKEIITQDRWILSYDKDMQPKMEHVPLEAFIVTPFCDEDMNELMSHVPVDMLPQLMSHVPREMLPEVLRVAVSRL